VWCW